MFAFTGATPVPSPGHPHPPVRARSHVWRSRHQVGRLVSQLRVILAAALVTLCGLASASVQQLGGVAHAFFDHATPVVRNNIPAGENRLLVVVASDAGATSIAGVTFNGTPMIAGASVTDNVVAVDSIWYLPLGTSSTDLPGQIQMTSTGISGKFLSAAVFADVDQQNPVVAGPTNNVPSGTNVGSALNVSSAVGDLVLDVFDSYLNSSTTFPVAGSGVGQTKLSLDVGTFDGGSASYSTSIKPGAPSVAMSWTSDGTAALHATINIRQAAVKQLGNASSQYLVSDTLTNFTVPAGEDRVLVVVASDPIATSVTSVTLGGLPLTQSTNVTDNVSVDTFWYRVLGTSTIDFPANIVMTSAGGQQRFISAVVFRGVDQATPVIAGPTTAGSTGASLLNIASATGDITLDVLDTYNSVAPSIVPGTGQTLVSSKSGNFPNGGFEAYGTSRATGDANGMMSWSGTAGSLTLHAAVTVKEKTRLPLFKVTITAASGVVVSADGAPSTSLSEVNVTQGYSKQFVTASQFGVVIPIIVSQNCGGVLTFNGQDVVFTTAPVMSDCSANIGSISLSNIVSRKQHNNIDRDIVIDSSKMLGADVSVEPRTIGGGHQIVFQFSGPVPAYFQSSMSASTTFGNVSGAINPNNSSEYIATLTGVPDNVRANVNLNTAVFGINAPVGFLVGDGSGNRRVNAVDIAAVKANVSKALGAANFQYDVDRNGVINGADVSAVKARSGVVIP